MSKIFTNFMDAIVYCASKKNNHNYDIIPIRDENKHIIYIVKEIV